MNVIHLKYPHQLQCEDYNHAYSLAIGFFDGVHKGHQSVIDVARQKARDLGIATAVMTFDPHPSIVLGGRNERVFYITPLQQKLKILEQMNIDTVFVVHFTSDFAKLSPKEFVDKFIRQLNVKHVTAGFDFCFGAHGKGNMEEMKNLSNGEYDVTTVEKYEYDNQKISSTRIRQVLSDGRIEEASLLLGRTFEITGIVIHGDKRGRQIGFPTANVQVSEGTLIPKIGVYAVKLKVQGEWYDGVCNIGYRPTFKNPDEKNISIEVHILNFSKNIYAEEVTVRWYTHIRNEQKFSGIDELVAQIDRDKQRAIDYFSHE